MFLELRQQILQLKVLTRFSIIKAKDIHSLFLRDKATLDPESFFGKVLSHFVNKLCIALPLFFVIALNSEESLGFF